MKKIFIRKLNLNKHLLQFNNRIFVCQIGKYGAIPSYRKIEGDGCTPMGNFKILKIYYRKDKFSSFNQRKLKRFDINKITRRCIWYDDPKTYRYNNYDQLSDSPFQIYSFEKLWRKDDVYDIILVLDYNINPVISKKGSAIFIHCSFDDNRATDGCVSLMKKDLKFILNNLQTIKYINIS